MQNSPLFFCSLCEKPFTKGQQYKRHTSYCIRSQNTARVRSRSCRTCHAAKTKCELVIGGTSSSGKKCKACVKKGVRCVFEGEGGNLDRGVGGNRKENSTREDLVMLGGEEMAMDLLLTPPLNPNDTGHDPAPTDMPASPDALMLQAYRRREDENVDCIEELFTDPVANSRLTTTSTTPITSGGFSYLPSNQEISTSPKNNNGFSFLNEEEFDYDYIISVDLNPIIAPTFPSPLSSFLTTPSSWLLTHCTPNAGQGAAQKIILTMMIDVIRTYPLMMAKHTSPPFIHSHFHTSPTLLTCTAISHLLTNTTSNTNTNPYPNYNSSSNSHSSTPTSNLNSNSNSNPHSNPFIWTTIGTEYRSFGVLALDDSWGRHEAVSALTASMCYLIMRAVYVGNLTGGNEEGVGEEMLMIHSAVKNRVIQRTPCWQTHKDEEISWIDWIYVESNRRIGCIWFVLYLIFHLQTNSPCIFTNSFRDIPLPCSKSEWEATSEEAWLRARVRGNVNVGMGAYGGFDGNGGGDMNGAGNGREKGVGNLCGSENRGLRTFGELMDARKEGRWRELDEWNCSVDGLGGILNMAVALVGVGSE